MCLAVCPDWKQRDHQRTYIVCSGIPSQIAITTESVSLPWRQTLNSNISWPPFFKDWEIKWDHVEATQSMAPRRIGVRANTQWDDVIKWKHFPRDWPFVRGTHRSPVNTPAQRPVTRSFGLFFDLRLNKRLSKQSWGWWFEILSRPLCHCNGILFPNLEQLFVVIYTLINFPGSWQSSRSQRQKSWWFCYFLNFADHPLKIWSVQFDMQVVGCSA